MIDRRAAANVYTGIYPASPTPGANVSVIRQQIGWGYSGIPVNTAAAPAAAAALQQFVYRGHRRMKARKRYA